MLFEVLTGCEYETAGDIGKRLAADLKFQARGMGFHDFSKCFFATVLSSGTGIHKNLSHSQYSHFQVLKNLDKILALSGFHKFSKSSMTALYIISKIHNLNFQYILR